MVDSASRNASSASIGQPAIGELLGGRYRLVRELGAGGLGTVFVAHDEKLRRDVALKLMHADVASRPEAKARFDLEMRALAALKHANIVTLLDFGAEGPATFLVMELAEGRPLDRVLEGGSLPLDVAIEASRQLLLGLAYAHERKIIHRDLKPANLVLDVLQNGSTRLVILDFGIAKSLEDDGDLALTKQGAILGTPAYMAPEQATGGKPRPALDVYAAGLVIFELLVGRRPFMDTDRAALLRAQITQAPPMASSIRAELANFPGLDAFLFRALEKKPTNRFEDASKMLEAFTRIFSVRTSSTPSASELPRVTGAEPASGSFGTSQPASGAFGLPQPAASALATGVTYADRSTVEIAAEHRAPSRFLDRRLLFAGAAIAIVATVVVVFLVTRRSPEAEYGGTAPAPLVVSIPGVQAPVPAAESPLSRGVPSELEDLHRSIVAGGNPSRGQLQKFYRYNAANRQDARGLLILGWTSANRRWFGEAIDAYREACVREPTSAHDARLRSDLIRFVGVERFSAPASRVIESCLGASAKAEVEAAEKSASGAEPRARYAELGRRLDALR